MGYESEEEIDYYDGVGRKRNSPVPRLTSASSSFVQVVFAVDLLCTTNLTTNDHADAYYMHRLVSLHDMDHTKCIPDIDLYRWTTCYTLIVAGIRSPIYRYVLAGPYQFPMPYRDPGRTR
ncbi:hypothetical protein QCA50_008327 [Cerrena zonata]|uniref:Uncharacterized protein n=1 Tax=Cerrena zonata TaxID=2478898 RepID=A0AAW0GB44_9APHY